ncbi:hypothetical protein [Leptolyngbya ohadii]|uniref:hypothetical protein n=1 Tax=Leptolyngbya ohadii TaxID=1962290 RepID=UPI000B59D63A|nr:hypothetical protein [Leptolyngbya ohadii]
MKTKSIAETQVKTYLWDIAGIDGLQAMKYLIGEGADRLAPFQSIETQIGRVDCSVLRLCEGNFRISCGEASEAVAQALSSLAPQRVWVRQFGWLGSIVLPEADLALLGAIAVPKPPHRLEGLPLNCAISLRIEEISVLIWHHSVSGQPALELHAAKSEIARLQAKLGYA